MKIFISWSGTKAKAAAYLLREWLPSVIQSLDVPWVSDIDIESGSNWSVSIGNQLSTCKFGIVCITRENQNRPWLNFEAGAISKLVDGAVPLLIDFNSPGDLVGGPMSQLQARMPNEDGITKLMGDINRRLERPLDSAVLDAALNRGFAEFQVRLAEINADPSYDQVEPTRPAEDKIEEILQLVRAQSEVRYVPNSHLSYGDRTMQQMLESFKSLDSTARATLVDLLTTMDGGSDLSDPARLQKQIERIASDTFTAAGVPAKFFWPSATVIAVQPGSYEYLEPARTIIQEIQPRIRTFGRHFRIAINGEHDARVFYDKPPPELIANVRAAVANIIDPVAFTLKWEGNSSCRVVVDTANGIPTSKKVSSVSDLSDKLGVAISVEFETSPPELSK